MGRATLHYSTLALAKLWPPSGCTRTQLQFQSHNFCDKRFWKVPLSFSAITTSACPSQLLI